MLQTLIFRVLCVMGTISGARAPRSEPGSLIYTLHGIGWAAQSWSSPFVNTVTHRNRNVGVSQFWELLEQGHASLQELSGRSLPCLFQLLVAGSFPSLVATPLFTPSLSFFFSLCLFLHVSFIRTLSIGCRAHWDNLGWSQDPQLKSAKMLFPNMVTFTGSRY